VEIVSAQAVKDDAEIQTYHEVDKRSLFVGLIIAPLILLILCLPWLLFTEMPPWWLIAFCLVWGGILSFFPLSAFRRYLISRLQSSWFIGWSEKGIWCRFRRPTLTPPSENVGIFAHIPAENVDWIRVLDKTQETTVNADLKGNGTNQKYLEIGLKKLDISALREVLKAEQIRMQSHISFQGPLLDLSDEGTLLAAVERPEVVVESLSEFFRVLETKVKLGKKFRDMSGAEMHIYIKSLVEGGDKIAAVRATTEGFKCTLTEANRFVDSLMAGQENVPLPRGAKDFTSK